MAHDQDITKIQIFGELNDNSNFEVVCEDENDDSCWIEGNPINSEFAGFTFKNWNEVKKTLIKYYDSDILEISSC